jgi:5-formyltetrahydrofolate cyclo-ligase
VKVRREKIEERRNILEEDRIKYSKMIMGKLSKMPEMLNAQTIMLYMPINNEVDTTETIAKLIAKGKKILVPSTLKTEKKMIAAEIKSFSELERGAFGVLEPKKESLREVPPENIELVLVPGVAFDEEGDRIGYGHGYYDRFLKLVKAPVIGLAYDFQIVDKITSNSHDSKVTKIITPSKVIDCNKIKD